ncbi:MAG: hypothetical protein ABR974_14160 [Bacteroidales bacterium]|jgi:hypothetical protein
MKNSIKISVILLTIMIAASSCSHSHRNRKEFRMGPPRMERFAMMHGMRHGNFQGGQWGGNFRQGPGFGFRGQFGPGMMGNRGFGQQMSIPNLTDKQKKEIADLRNQQMEEMKKFREDNMAKMQSMMAEHKKNFMNILTDDQKKYLEGGSRTEPPSGKQ